MNECCFTIPSIPTSVNSLYQVIYSQRRVVLKDEVRRWRSESKVYIPHFELESAVSLIRVDCVFYYSFFTRDGKLKVFDSHNVVKPLIDLIAEKQGWNDKRAKFGSWASYDCASERVEVVLKEIVI